jgi:nanoRNase/pAp phosphatase (c-di-AMP/oligoRNAs hydrolase)
VRREFDYFDDRIIDREFDQLPPKDAARPIVVMDHYETVGFEDPKPAKVQDSAKEFGASSTSSLLTAVGASSTLGIRSRIPKALDSDHL